MNKNIQLGRYFAQFLKDNPEVAREIKHNFDSEKQLADFLGIDSRREPVYDCPVKSPDGELLGYRHQLPNVMKL